MTKKEPLISPTTANGVTLYPSGHLPSLPADMPELPQSLSQFGFKIITFAPPGGKEMRVWAVGTEADLREAEAQRLGTKTDEVVIECTADFSGGCFMLNGVCGGICHGGPFCNNASYGNYYYCVCFL
jgi:hypothetical protein